MRMFRVAPVVAVLACILIAGSAPAQAASISATDGGSHATITTPIKAPSEGACVRIPYRYTLDKDVDYAATVILDANSAMVARSPELAAGTGTGKLALCGATLLGKAAPFTLQLQVTYSAASGKGAVTAVSPTFTFRSKPLTCKKTTKPGKGDVKKFTTGACPKGWTLVQGG